MRILSDLIGTLQNSFRISGMLIKYLGGSPINEAALRDKADSDYIGLVIRYLQLKSEGGNGTFILPGSPSSDLTFTLPSDAGSTSQALLTDGAGNLYWGTVATGSNAMKTQEEIVAFNSAGSISLFVPPQNAIIHRVIVSVETVFDGAAELAVVDGAANVLFSATASELDQEVVFEGKPMFLSNAVDPNDREVSITYTAGGATVGSARVLVTYSNPA